MSTLKRFQRKRIFGWKMPPNSVYVGRPTKWGNPYHVNRERNASEAVQAFRTYAITKLKKDSAWLEPLKGKDLVCWCPPHQPCHADVLLELANAPDPNDDLSDMCSMGYHTDY